MVQILSKYQVRTEYSKKLTYIEHFLREAEKNNLRQMWLEFGTKPENQGFPLHGVLEVEWKCFGSLLLQFTIYFYAIIFETFPLTFPNYLTIEICINLWWFSFPSEILISNCIIIWTLQSCKDCYTSEEILCQPPTQTHTFTVWHSFSAAHDKSINYDPKCWGRK